MLSDQKIGNIDSIDHLFNPSDYLVSPFNSANAFLGNKYFLTHQQEDVKGKIIESINSITSANFISIVGSAGTGKTLLVYDFVKEMMGSKKKPLIIHCGKLNEGQCKLTEIGWDIILIKKYAEYDLSIYNVVV